MVENSVRGVPTTFEHGRDFPRDYTHVLDVVQLTLKALDAEPQAIKDRIFYAATGEKLVTAGQVAAIVKDLISEAAIEIGPGLSEADLVEIAYRGVLDVSAGRDQLGYVPRFANIRDGLAEYIERHREYLAAGGQS
jgi:nucleoside-diphosphate-sugar epimerase